MAPSLSEMYSRRSDGTAQLVQQNFKAPVDSNHPYDMILVLYAGKSTNTLPTSTLTVVVEIQVEYKGYFTDRVNAYAS